LLFIVDSEGVLTVLKAITKTLKGPGNTIGHMGSGESSLSGKSKELEKGHSSADVIDGIDTEPKIKPDLIQTS
jgi:hypothetical protein